MNNDILHAIASQANDQTAGRLMQTNKNMKSSYFWKNKCDPNKPYFDTWTIAENYLAQNMNQPFAIFINFGTNLHVEEYLFEYHPMLMALSSLEVENVCRHDDNNLHDLIVFDLEDRFIVSANVYLDCAVIGQFKDRDDAMNGINDHRKKMILLRTEVDYYVIDLSKMTPFFVKEGCLSKRKKSKQLWTFLGYDELGTLKRARNGVSDFRMGDDWIDDWMMDEISST